MGEVSGVRLGSILPDEMSAIEERLTAVRQRVHEQLAIRWWNERVVPAGQNKDGGLDAWQKRLQAPPAVGFARANPEKAIRSSSA